MCYINFCGALCVHCKLLLKQFVFSSNRVCIILGKKFISACDYSLCPSFRKCNILNDTVLLKGQKNGIYLVKQCCRNAVQQTLIHVVSSILKVHIFCSLSWTSQLACPVCISVILCHLFCPYPYNILLSFHEDNLLHSLRNVSSYLPFDTL